MKTSILGYDVDTLSVEECVTSVLESCGGQGDNKLTTCKWLACINPHSYAVSRTDAQFARALRDADWLVPDGAGIVLASRLLNGNVRERVTGSDVFEGLHQRLNAVGGMSVFFLGATEDTLRLIRERMLKDYPRIRVAGTYSPPFKPTYSAAEIALMLDAINGASADVLWVGMTAPKQEKWIYENKGLLNVRVAAAVGAVFDFYAGRVKRSHPLFQRVGLEWLPRLLQEPRRLWRRMFVSAPIFLWHVFLQKIGMK